ncbi:MAG: hypothetical protein J1E35_03080 [Lachnospiraceae bacterium]|nr:hypothetical protein [Lachnospiraceae bacterium]
MMVISCKLIRVFYAILTTGWSATERSQYLQTGVRQPKKTTKCKQEAPTKSVPYAGL